MHLTVVRMLHQESPELARNLEHHGRRRGHPLTTRPPGPAQGETAMSTSPRTGPQGRVAGVLGSRERGDLGPVAWPGARSWITTFCLTLAFVAWFLAERDHPQAQRTSASTSRRTSSTGWPPCRASRPACCRLVWMIAAADHGHPQDGLADHACCSSRSTLGWGVRVQYPDRPVLGAHGAGLPRRHRRRRVLRLHAEHVVLLPQAQAGHGAGPAGRARQLRRLVRAAAHALPHRHLGRSRSSAAASR